MHLTPHAEEGKAAQQRLTIALQRGIAQPAEEAAGAQGKELRQDVGIGGGTPVRFISERLESCTPLLTEIAVARPLLLPAIASLSKELQGHRRIGSRGKRLIS